ncbi:MAG: glyceraldehyde-3-phosphate dehydrogenase [Gemmatimonadetes bacterium]|nr:glyceraldehyde-3-phosphate dehydrogenase [Gemmatimonadota bacterium]MBT8402282.1 glyceraldehyde-3-phosphate dehydrogenase [Gemmatimonadota bacterium]NNK64612.1 glyceraldehyde-3-phosphate dehydrogenase [Gemmatimonadota bacterium]
MSGLPQTEALGINGLGRIGKLTVWHHVARRHFPRLVVNLGREAGRSLEDVCQTIEKDSTYGRMHHFLFGVGAEPCIRIEDRERGILRVADTPVQILREARNPKDIGWRDHGVRVVVDTTGAFGDPTDPLDAPGGSLRGHRAAGAEKVVYSAAFKIKDKARSLPDDSALLIYGINHELFDPARHDLVSAASCTTTALAHMVKPILDRLRYSNVLTASMSTVHAVTNTQSVLDNVPKAGAKDLRRSRSILNNVILTSTNAAAALEQVIPEIAEVGFMADSVRIPVPTESLIILNMTFQSRLDDDGQSSVTRQALNDIYRSVAEGEAKGLLVYSEEQNVSADVSGMKAAVVIEGVETHTRTGFVDLDLRGLEGLDPALLESTDPVVQVPVTHAKVCGWYDNEYGSYTNLLGDLTVYVRSQLD